MLCRDLAALSKSHNRHLCLLAARRVPRVSRPILFGDTRLGTSRVHGLEGHSVPGVTAWAGSDTGMVNLILFVIVSS
jgi:hypothetical protein